jgi:SAM-dependent methyltransferase
MRICVACDEQFTDGSWTCPRCGYHPPGDELLRFAPDFPSGEGLLEESFEHLDAVEDASFWFRSRNRLIAWTMERYFPGTTSFLEVGCGTGYVGRALARRFPDMRIVGGEPFEAGARVAVRRMPTAEIIQMDGRHIPFTDEFDVVGAFDVLEHIPEQDAVLAQMHQALVPRGGIVVTVPQHPWLWSPLDDYAQHQRRYTREELVRALQRAGFRVDRVTSFVTFLLPLMLASRVRGRGKPVDPVGELTLPDGLDRGLERVMAVEAALIKRGVDFPAGGSLLAVGRRVD